MTIWPPNKAALTRPIYRSLANAILSAIDQGQLLKGDRLPTHRDLAYELQISIQTVSRAYEELTRIGAISGEVGRGSYVLGKQSDTKSSHFYLPTDQRSKLIDLSVLNPVCEQIHLDAMQSVLKDMSESLPPDVVMSFRPAVTRHPHLEQARKWLQFCGLTTSLESILLTNGSTSSMTVALMTAARSGDYVITEEFGHHTLKALTGYLGMKIGGCPIDEEGIIPEELERMCLLHHPKVLFLMPDGLNPKARIMGTSRRKEIAELAKKYDFLIIENDAWGPIQEERKTPIACFAPDRVFYFTGMSKCLMPGLRAGFLVLPDEYAAAARNRHLVTNWKAAAISMEIASRWISDGTAKKLLNWQKSALSSRNDLVKTHLSGTPYFGTNNGMHIWLPLPEWWSEDAFIARLRNEGVGVGPGSAFAIDAGKSANAIRVCLGNPSVDELVKGLIIINNLIRQQPDLDSLSL